MSEDALIRYTNLEAICAANNWGPSELAAQIGRSVSQASDMLRRKKTFGEKIARDIEQRLNLPRNWLDVPHGSAEIIQASAPVVMEKSPTYQTLHLASSNNTPQPKGGHTPITPLTLGGWVTYVARAPIVAWACLGEDLRKSNQNFRDEDQRFYTTTGPMSERSKFVQVSDDALSPKLVRGDFVLIDPDNLSPERDRVALFSGPDGGFFLRRYRPLANDDFEAYDESGRTLEGKKHGLKVEGTFVTLQRDDA